jgi:hypothetical protein
MKTWIATSTLMFASAIAFAQSIVPCEIVVPLLDSNGKVVAASAPDGHSYPVFQIAPQSKLVDGVRHTLATSFAQEALRLDRDARNLTLAKQRQAPIAQNEEWFTSPMYLLMSTEEGGFARFGFWLQNSAGKRRLVLAGYVDLVIEDGLDDGIFSHELGHLILKTLTGGLPDGESRKMHQSMTVTDYPTAFDEGYAEHFEPLAAEFDGPKPESKTWATDFGGFWLSAADGQLRLDGVKRNLFIHRKPLPESVFDEPVDLYRVFVDAETSTAFLPTTLKNGQQMMASEGVISTLFYRIVKDDQLRNHYREPSFYRPFLKGDSSHPEDVITPAENVNLKLFAAMTELQGIGRDLPPMITLIEHYAKLFPDEAKRIYGDFIATTWGTTASQPLASQLVRAAEDGGRGDISAFRRDRASTLFDSTIAEVADGKRSLGTNVGPELWIVNPDFRIASAMWVPDRQLPLTINLNTATEPELMTIGGVDLTTARKVVTTRNGQGFFQSLDNLQGVVSPEVMRKLKSMSGQMKQLPAYRRE